MVLFSKLLFPILQTDSATEFLALEEYGEKFDNLKCLT